MTITFETKVWENDWELVLKTPRLEKMIGLCFNDTLTKRLYINNVNNFELVKEAAQKYIDQKLIDQFIIVDEYSDRALDFFDLSREKLGRGYYYSIAELVSIYLTETKYLLHFSSDSIVAPETPETWLLAGITILEENPDIKVFNLTWNHCYVMAQRESQTENENYYFGYGFSDQMYLIRTADFKQRIYEYYDKASERYPSYGGELFEKRVDSWMRQNKFLRATYKHGSYIHQNFPKKETRSL